MKKLFAFLILIISCSTIKSAEPEVSFGGDKITLHYLFDDLRRNESSTSSPEIVFTLDGYSEIFEPGRPSLLSRSETFRLPEQKIPYEITVNVITDTIIGNCRGIELPQIDSDPVATPAYVEVTPYEGIWPAQWAAIEPTGVYRGINIGNISINPVKYDWNRRMFIVCKEMSVTISLSEEALADTPDIKHTYDPEILSDMVTISLSDSSEDAESLIEESLLSNSIANQDENSFMPGYTFTIPDTYLIITPEEFKDEAERLAKWKRRMGYNVEVQVASTDNLNNPQYIYNSVKSLYDTDSYLKYVLFFGSGYHISPQAGRYPYNGRRYYTDFYYSCLDGDDDLIPDVAIGRLPIYSLKEAEICVDKIISYEGSQCSPEFYETGLHVGYFEPYDKYTEGRRFVRTSEEIRQYMSAVSSMDYPFIYFKDSESEPKYWGSKFGIPGPMPDFLQYPNYEWNGSTEKIIDQINKGKFYVLYRGHGTNDGWHNAQFSNKSVSMLNNGKDLPLFFGITCNSGMFYHDKLRSKANPCFGEKLVLKENGGAIGYFGASQVSYSRYNEYLAVGMFNAINPNPGLQIDAKDHSKDTKITLSESENLKHIAYSSSFKSKSFSEILNTGARAMFKAYNSNESSTSNIVLRTSREMFHCLGDPSLKLKTKIEIDRPAQWMCIGSELYCIDYRPIVLVDKNTNEVKIAHAADGNYKHDLGSLMNDYYISLIQPGVLPVLLNGSGDFQTNAKFINNISINNSEVNLTYSDVASDVVVQCFDFYGTKIAEVSGRNGSATLTLPVGMIGCLIVTENGEFKDSATIKIK